MARLVIVRSNSATATSSAVPPAAEPVRAALLALVSRGEHTGQVSEAALVTWRRVEAELSPILGSAGVAALYRRSLVRARVEGPALAEVYDATAYAKGFEPLRYTLSSLSHADAVVASRALMWAFWESLTDLISAPLTARLLEPAIRPQAPEPGKKEATP
ncbi:MAG: hypothetical protein LT082_09105 [Comamonas sp.]|jgi:hypothetical protein|nr:hypothetical protein [Comamonas sp.]